MAIAAYLPISPHRSSRPDYGMPLPAIGDRVNVGYGRKSRVTGSLDRVVSDDQQNGAIDELAVEDGVEPTTLTRIFEMGRSGAGKKIHLRTDYLRLKAMIEADQVDTLYAYSLSRLGRNTVEVLQLVKLCYEHGTRIRLAKDSWLNQFPAGSYWSTFMITIFAGVGQLQLDMMTEVTKDAMEELKDDGIKLGQTAYGYRKSADRTDKKVHDEVEWPNVLRIIELFAANERNYLRTARAATGEGIKPRRRSVWSAHSIRLIVQREAPALLPVTRERRVKPAAPFKFFRLLRCSCGHILTGHREVKGGRTYVRYSCSRAPQMLNHPPVKSVSEPLLLGWAREEAARLSLPKQRIRMVESNSVALAELEEELAAIAYNHRKKLPGYRTEEECDAKVGPVQAEIERLEKASRAVAAPTAPDWDGWTDVEINAGLRTLWTAIELDERLRPVRAQWVDPVLLGDEPQPLLRSA